MVVVQRSEMVLFLSFSVLGLKLRDLATLDRIRHLWEAYFTIRDFP